MKPAGEIISIQKELLLKISFFKTDNYSLSGIIHLDDGVGTTPVKDAVIKGANIWGVPSYDNQIPSSKRFNIFTFSNENGSFDLTAPIAHSFNQDQTIDYSKILYLNIAAAGSNKKKILPIGKTRIVLIQTIRIILLFLTTQATPNLITSCSKEMREIIAHKDYLTEESVASQYTILKTKPIPPDTN